MASDYEEAGIEHQSMRLALDPVAAAGRAPAVARGPSQRAVEFDGIDAAVDATRRLLLDARRELVLYTRDLEHALYARPVIVEAFKQFAVAGRGGVARILVQDPVLAQRQPHPLLALAQRLPTAFLFRTPVDPEDMQYASVFLANDRDGYSVPPAGQPLRGRLEPGPAGAQPPAQRAFRPDLGACRPCTEFRALGL